MERTCNVASFYPTHKAEIVVIVISENDTKGGGGISAAPIVGKIMRTYIKSKKTKANFKVSER